MVTQELQNYVDQSRASGISDEIIRQNLIKQGWAEADLNSVLGPPLSREPFEAYRYTAEDSPFPLKSVVVVIILIIVLAALGFLYCWKESTKNMPNLLPPISAQS